ncbi:MAG: TlpA family protein disulfide reductase [Candidatus Dormibacteria bacterium]
MLAGCGEAASPGAAVPSPTPSIPPLQAAMASSNIVVGKDQRVALGILNGSGVPIPYVTVRVQIVTVPAAGSAPRPIGSIQDAPYNGGAPGQDLLQGKGVYVIHASFETPGFYRAVVDATKDGTSTRTSAAFTVAASDPTPAVGSQAPATQNATLSQVSDISTIDTGVPPDDMHSISVAGALAAHHPFVVYFGSPGFCVSRTCGPEVEVVKSLESANRQKGVDFIHIETYKGGRPDAQRSTSPWFDDWKLQSDPWVFVVDRAGIIRAKFESPTGPQEIQPAIDAVIAG